MEAAKNAGVETVIIPYKNYYPDLERVGVKIIPLKEVRELWEYLFKMESGETIYNKEPGAIVASGI